MTVTVTNLHRHFPEKSFREYYDSFSKQKQKLDENGRICLERAGLIAYAHGEYFALGDRIGKFGFSAAKETKRSIAKKNAPKTLAGKSRGASVKGKGAPKGKTLGGKSKAPYEKNGSSRGKK